MLTGAARADVPPVPEEGTKFVECTLEVFGLTDPDLVLVGFDRPFHGGLDLSRVTIGRWLRLTPERTKTVLADRGRSSMYGPSLFIMTKTGYDRWAAATELLVEAQRQACATRGEGCLHISRFVPRVPAPTDAVDCDRRVGVERSVPHDGPDRVAHRLRVVHA